MNFQKDRVNFSTHSNVYFKKYTVSPPLSKNDIITVRKEKKLDSA